MRKIAIDFVNDRVMENFCLGIRGEHNATQITIVPPADMPLTLSYRLAFEPGGLSETLFLTDGKIFYEIPKAITQNDKVSMTLEGYEGEERVYKSKMVYLYFDDSVDVDEDLGEDEPLLRTEISENTKARHTHENKEILDGFGVDEKGNPTFNGELIKSPYLSVVQWKDLNGVISSTYLYIFYPDREDFGQYRIDHLPSVSSADDGKILVVENGFWTLAKNSGGAETPENPTTGATDGITLIDQVTGKQYTLYVSDGKLMLAEVESEG